MRRAERSSGYQLRMPLATGKRRLGATTAEDVTARFEGLDQNGDGYVCAQLSTGFQRSGPDSVYSYNTSDDNASVPS
jgi:hypothetical protein